MTRQDMKAIKESETTTIEKMRAVYQRYSDAGLELLLESILDKRIARKEKALMLAVGLADLKQRSESRAKYILVQIQLCKYGEQIMKEMRSIQIAA